MKAEKKEAKVLVLNGVKKDIHPGKENEENHDKPGGSESFLKYNITRDLSFTIRLSE